jgi:hypothetical protein
VLQPYTDTGELVCGQDTGVQAAYYLLTKAEPGLPGQVATLLRLPADGETAGPPWYRNGWPASSAWSAAPSSGRLRGILDPAYGLGSDGVPPDQ